MVVEALLVAKMTKALVEEFHYQKPLCTNYRMLLTDRHCYNIRSSHYK